MGRDTISILPGIVLLTVFIILVIYWMYSTIGVLSAAQFEQRDLCAGDVKWNQAPAAHCMTGKE